MEITAFTATPCLAFLCAPCWECQVSAARSAHPLRTTLISAGFEVVQNNISSLSCCPMTGSQVIAFGGDSHCGDGRGSCHNGHSTHWLLNLTVSTFVATSPYYSFSRRS